MTPLLQLAQETFSRKLALEVLDCSLDTLAVDDDLQGLALYGFARVRQGTGTFANLCMECKSRNRSDAGLERLFCGNGPLGRLFFRLGAGLAPFLGKTPTAASRLGRRRSSASA
jgi:hypothetical protein